MKAKWYDDIFQRFLSDVELIADEEATTTEEDEELKSLLCSHFGGHFEHYRYVLLAMRNLILLGHHSPFFDHFIESWFSISMSHLLSSVVDFVAGDVSKDKLWSDRFRTIRSNIVAAPAKMKTSVFRREWRRFCDKMSFRFDPHLHGSLPYTFFTVILGDDEHKVRNIRLGSPTLERRPKQEADIIPEFRSFIEVYKRQGKRHLYVNLQRRHAPWYGKLVGFDNEANRCDAIESLHEDYPDTFYVISLAKNSRFYYQLGEYRDRRYNLWPAFKETFLKELAGNTCFFPEWHDDFVVLMDEVHETVFHSATAFNRQARRDFIEIFYTRLIEYFVVKMKVDSYNVSCRDSIDRGACANSLLYVYFCLCQGKDFDDDTLKTMLFGPALLVRQRALMRGRLERFISAVQRLQASDKLSNNIELKGLI